MKIIIRTVVLIFLVALAYAIIRYNVFGGIAWSRLPLYIINKAFAVTALFLLLIIYLMPAYSHSQGWKFEFWHHRALLGKITFIFVLSHTIGSLLLFNPVEYAKLFGETGNLNLNGGISMLFGIISLAGVWFINRLYIPDYEHPGEIKQYSHYLLSLVILFLMIHLFFMGYEGWFKINAWPGWLPPISLLSFLMIAWSVLYHQFSKKKKLT